jgi:hypothetical protein
VAHLAVLREVHSGAGHEIQSALLFEGPAVPGILPLEIRGETWIFRDEPDLFPEGASLAYTLQLEMTDGRRIRLDGLNGPSFEESSLRLVLLPAYPNPFNPTTSLTFRSPAGQETICRVVDMRGWHVATLFSGNATGRWQRVNWNGHSDDGRFQPAGIYLVQLICEGRSQTRRIVLTK